MPKNLAVAVSGGGDSVAMMHLLSACAADGALAMPAMVIVDHGLPAHTGKEPKRVSAWAKKLGLKPHILYWKGVKPKSNIEGAAREARYRLMQDWAKANRIGAIFLAHTEDDQAETFLIRLSRGSGVDGLSAMRSRGALPVAGTSVQALRPLLSFTRAELRHFLRERGAEWLEDPMNEDPRYLRTRLRKLRPALEELGLSAPRIALAASHLSRAREALDAQRDSFFVAHTRGVDNGMALDGAALARLPREIGLRVLSAALVQVAGKPYRPRFEALQAVYEAVLAARPARTLGDCRIGQAPRAKAVFGAATCLVTRETERNPAKKVSSGNVTQKTRKKSVSSAS